MKDWSKEPLLQKKNMQTIMIKRLKE